MLFPSAFFLLYILPAAILLYWSIPSVLQNGFLLLLSLTLYAWGDPMHLVPMLILVVANHLLGRGLDGADNPVYKKRIVRWAVILNVGTLLLAFYGESAARFLAGLFGASLPEVHLSAPVGISFFSLQAMTYVFEIARGKAHPEKSIVKTGLFIAFLPTVFAGPILRFSDLSRQLHARTMSLELFGLGCERLVVGYAKLVVLAVPLNRVASDIFARSVAGNQFYSTPVVLAWLGVFAFGLQYYLTFSGISDMAIGLARLFGFSIPENFKYPYVAHTMREFWNRWHISLYRWFYVYFFMVQGGSRAKKVRFRGAMRSKNFVLRNTFFMWLLLGLWHGISWSHALFGFWFFIFAFFEWVVSLQRKNTRNPLWMIYVLFVVAVGWVFLRCGSFMESMTYLSNMLGLTNNGFFSDFAVLLVRENWHFLLLGIIAATPFASMMLGWINRLGKGWMGYVAAGCHLLVLAGLVYLCCVFSVEADSIPPIMYNW